MYSLSGSGLVSKLSIREFKSSSHNKRVCLSFSALKNEQRRFKVEMLVASGKPRASDGGIVGVCYEPRSLQRGPQRFRTLGLANAIDPFPHAAGLFHVADRADSFEAEQINEFPYHGARRETSDFIEPVGVVPTLITRKE